MKITVKRDTIVSSLDIVSRAIPSRSYLPINQMMMLEVIGDRCYIYAKNPEYQVKGFIRVNSDDDHGFKFCVPGHLFYNTIKLLTSEEVMISTTEKDEKFTTTISVPGKRKKYKMPGVDPEEFFPLTIDKENMDKVKIHGESFIEGIKKCIGIANSNDIRRSLSGISIRKEGDTIEISSGTQMCCCTVGIGSDENVPEMILMRGTTSVLESLPVPNQIQVGMFENKAVINTGQFMIISSVVDEKYPNFKQIRDATLQQDKSMVINKEDLIGAMRRIQLYSSKESKVMKITITEGSVSISAENKALSTSANEEIEVESNNLSTFSAGFDASLISRALAKIESENVTVHMKDEKSPMFIIDNEETGAVKQEWMISAISLN